MEKIKVKEEYLNKLIDELEKEYFNTDKYIVKKTNFFKIPYIFVRTNIQKKKFEYTIKGYNEAKRFLRGSDNYENIKRG